MADPERADPGAAARLRAIKSAHTVIWAFFAGCILAIPAAAWLGHFRAAAWLAGAVCAEIVVLLVNSWSCPLTAIAARYTADRKANFDIYLPEWLARHNKSLFGALYLAGMVFTIVRWARASG